MKKLLSYTAALLFLFATSGCTDEESGMGMNLVDSTTLYHGQQTTFTADRALSVRDDSLSTTNYSFGVIGNYQDATFGSVSATLYTQIALDDQSSSINLRDNIIDSVVLTLVKNHLYPDSTATYNFHFEVMHLAEPLLSDTVYYSFHELAVDPAAKYFDQTVTVQPTDTVVRLKLDNSISTILNQTGSAEEFIAATKGLRIRITDAGDPGMMGINFSATNTCLTVYHRYSADDTVDAEYPFLLGYGTAHFIHFEHDYTGSTVGGVDSIPGTTDLYLEPLAGYNLLVTFDNAIRTFADAHPNATVHQAELLLPVTASVNRPDRVLAVSKKAAGNDVYIDDLMMDITDLSRFDGKYDASRNCYRLRVTQHVQGLLRQKSDPGTLLVLNSRRSSAARVIINGLSNPDHIRIELTYSE